jgi:hypothetical protein
MNESDQDIDTAGTEADEEFHERHQGEQIEAPDVTKAPAGAPPERNEEPRGSEPRTLPRAEDDEVVRQRSPEFHDRET